MLKGRILSSMYGYILRRWKLKIVTVTGFKEPISLETIHSKDADCGSVGRFRFLAQIDSKRKLGPIEQIRISRK